MTAAAMPRDVAVPRVSADGAAAQLETGEILLLPTPLWTAIDQACEIAGRIEDPAAARTAFAGAFAEALHRAGLLLVEAVDPKSTQSVSVQTYSLALDGKHTVEAKLGAITKLVLGWSDTTGAIAGAGESLLDELAHGVLANAGRAAPDERPRLQNGFLRIRALHAIVEGSPTAGWDLANAPPFPDGLAKLFKGDIA